MKTLSALALLLSVLALAPVADAAGADRRADLSVTTVETGGKYAPRHVRAVWITDAQDRLVRTIDVRARKRRKYLGTWLAALGDREPNGISGATLKEHGAATFSWDCRDEAGQPVAGGVYRWRVELTDRNRPGPVTPPDHLAFTVGPEPYEAAPADLPNFRGLRVAFTP